MGKFFVSASVALVLLVFGANLVSAEGTVTAPNEVTVEGQVTAIKGNTLQIKDNSGYNHSFKVTDPTMLNEFKSGDNVEISIQKPMSSTPAPTPMRSTPAPTPMKSTPAPTPTPR